MRRPFVVLATAAALVWMVAAGPGPGAGAALADTLGELRAGNAAFGEGRYDAAVEAYTRAILAGDLDPEALAVTFNNRGVAYGELGDYDRAIADYGQALGLKPGDATALKNLRIGHTRRAAAAANLGEHDQALADYARATELDPRHPLAYLRRGQLRLERGEPGPAAADLARARELDPTNREAAELLARAEASLAVGRQAGLPATGAVAPPAPPAPGTAAGAAPGAATGAVPANVPTETDAVTGAPTSQDGAAVAEASQTPRQLPPVQVEEGPERRFRVVQSVNMREGPSNDYPRVGFLVADTVVSVVGEKGNWMLVRLRSGKRGFVYRRFLEEAAPG